MQIEKERIKEFIVEEILNTGKICTINYSPTEKLRDLFFIFKKPKDYIHLTLVKKNLSSLEAIRILANKLHVSIKRIGFAGNKDKKAITSQRISIFIGDGKKAKRIARGFKKVKHKNFFLKNFDYADERINLGMLKGNRFTVTIKGSKEEIKKLSKFINKLRRDKIIIPNFFDSQRFGKTKKNHEIGKAIVNGKFDQAVKLILVSYGENESKEIKEIKKYIMENFGKWNGALVFIKEKIRNKRWLRKKLFQEISLIKHLVKFPNDYVNALRKIPKKILRFYIHAYQAYLFNLMLKEIAEKKIKAEELPLIGYESKIHNKNKKVGEIVYRVMKKEKISFDDFKIKSMPELSEKGVMRKVFFEVHDLKVGKQKAEGGHLTLSFWLKKGSYATTFLKYLLNFGVLPISNYIF